MLLRYTGLRIYHHQETSMPITLLVLKFYRLSDTTSNRCFATINHKLCLCLLSGMSNQQPLLYNAMWGMKDRSAIPMPQEHVSSLLFTMPSFFRWKALLAMRCGSTNISIPFLSRGLCSNLSFVTRKIYKAKKNSR